MSHALFLHSILSDGRVWSWLHQVDEAEAARCREAGCRHCDGKLHSATYPRKPYGLAPELRDEGARRFSFCCAVCRRRVTSISARFFGWRFHVGALFLLVSALALRGGVRLETIGRKWRIPVRTFRRWRQWWREAFPRTGPWQVKRGELAMPSEEEPLLFLLRHMSGAGFRERLLQSLVWLMPWTGYCALGDGPAVPAESGSIADRQGVLHRHLPDTARERRRHGQQQRERRPRPVGALALCGGGAASGLAAACGAAAV